VARFTRLTMCALHGAHRLGLLTALRQQCSQAGANETIHDHAALADRFSQRSEKSDGNRIGADADTGATARGWSRLHAGCRLGSLRQGQPPGTLDDKPGSARCGQEPSDLFAEAETGEQRRQNQTDGAPQTDNHEVARHVSTSGAEPCERSSTFQGALRNLMSGAATRLSASGTSVAKRIKNIVVMCISYDFSTASNLRSVFDGPSRLASLVIRRCHFLAAPAVPLS